MATKYKKPLKQEAGPKIVCQNKECPFMGKYQPIGSFYKSRNAAMPHHPFCKTCVNKMVKEGDMQTVYDVLKVLDIPFIRDIWDSVCVEGDDYMGAYLSLLTTQRMYNDYHWDDSIFEPTSTKDFQPKKTLEDNVPKWSDEWQGKYTPADLKYLNDYYNGLQNDFKIITTNHKDYAKKIAQASLSQTKAYQKMLRGDDGADVAYEKATKIFDMLSKSAQFAESQRSANDVSLGCFGRVFDAVEKHNWVPTHIPDDEDMYDKLLKQFSNIEKSL